MTAINEKTGIVVSDKMTKTRIVAVSKFTRHKKYGKVIMRTKRYAVHDPNSSTSTGDKVRIRKTRPFSKTVHWTIV